MEQIFKRYTEDQIYIFECFANLASYKHGGAGGLYSRHNIYMKYLKEHKKMTYKQIAKQIDFSLSLVRITYMNKNKNKTSLKISKKGKEKLCNLLSFLDEIHIEQA